MKFSLVTDVVLIINSKAIGNRSRATEEKAGSLMCRRNAGKDRTSLAPKARFKIASGQAERRFRAFAQP